MLCPQCLDVRRKRLLTGVIMYDAYGTLSFGVHVCFLNIVLHSLWTR